MQLAKKKKTFEQKSTWCKYQFVLLFAIRTEIFAQLNRCDCSLKNASFEIWHAKSNIGTSSSDWFTMVGSRQLWNMLTTLK